MKYINLHCHSHYSGLDGIGSPEEYMARAAEIGMTHLAVTDHGNLMGHREWQREAKKYGITPILGLEGYQTTDRFDKTSNAKRADGDLIYNHLTLLAMNGDGLHNLNKISDIAWHEGFYMKPRFDFDTLEDHNENIIALSGCMSGMIAKAITAGDDVKVNALVQRYLAIFGRERFFIEIMAANPIELNKGLLEVAEHYKIKSVVTDDCHHVRKEDLWVQEATLILNTNPKLNKEFDFNKSQKMDFIDRFNYMYPDRTMTFQDFGLFLHTYDEHRKSLAKQGIGTESIENTMIIADMIGDYPYYEGLDLLPEPKTDPTALLLKKVNAGLKRIGKENDPVYRERIDHELELMMEKGFESYFLIAENTVTWARSQDIFVGPGRGSAAGSLVCYCLGITSIDPIEYKLLFFRFLDPTRDDKPDVDIDIEGARRNEVKDYTRRKFKHVASIATVGLFKDAGTIRDAARVFKIPLGEVNKALKNVDTYESFLQSPTTAEFRMKYPEVIQLCDKLRGHVKSIGMHAGGLVISKEPISNYVPMQTAKDTNDPLGNRVPVVGVDMKEAEAIGLIKFDFLGLKALSILKDTINLIKERHNPDFDIYKLPMDDAETYKMLSQGYTKMVFQCEQSAYTRTILEMDGVDNFDELVASNALVRPGAAKSSFGAKFIAGKRGNYEYIHADTKHFTDTTYGSILYQEQQMLLCTELCGMSMNDANKVRRAIGKKKLEELEKWEGVFVEGASKKIGSQAAQDLWTDLLAAAEYSFNLSHAVAYSMISYWTAYLKRHYTIEFVTAALHHESDNNSVVDYLMEAKRLGVKIKLPHVNTSGVHFEIQNDGTEDYIRIGLSNIKYISEATAPRLIAARPYKNYKELYDHVTTKGSGLSSRSLQGMNAVGAAKFVDNPLKGNERDNFFEFLNIPSFEVKDLSPAVKERFRKLDEYTENEAFLCMGMVREIKVGQGKGWSRVDFIDETGTAGAFADEHTPIEAGKMYVFLIAANRIARYVSVDDVVSAKGGGFVKFILMNKLNDVPGDDYEKVISFSTRKTKKGSTMGNVVFADKDKNMTPALVFPSKDFMKIFARCKEGAIVRPVYRTTDDGTLYVVDIK